jgi:hypothetical protein
VNMLQRQGCQARRRGDHERQTIEPHH